MLNIFAKIKATTKNLEQILYSIKIKQSATRMGLSLSEIKSIISPVKITSHSINSQQNRSKYLKKMQIIIQFIVIVGFLLLTSYISITRTEIGKGKENHLIESILSSISIQNYFAGKMLGILFLLVFQFFIYSILFMITVVILYILLSAIVASFISRIEDISQVTTSVASLLLIPYIAGLVASTNHDLKLIKCPIR